MNAPDPHASIHQAGKLLNQARKVLAYDNFDSILHKPLLCDEHSAFPQFVESAQGFEFTDSLGRVYVDWVNSGGPVLLGHRRPEVEQAIIQQLAAGPSLPLMHPLEVEVATLLTEMIPNADVVAFGKNGSDGLTGATRLARAITGGDILLHYGMHGFHDWFVCSNPIVRGVPEVLRPLIHPFEYNDLEGLEALFERFKGRVAAVVMEPIREIMPKDGYLAAVKEMTQRHGALLIWDEVVTALRLGPGGAQEYLGVEPDLACLGKALANGMPISALVGRRDLMEQSPTTAFGMTFRGETLALAAARATLRIVRDEPVAEHIARIGSRVREIFSTACERHGVSARLNGPPARMTFGFDGDAGLEWEEIQRLFLQECIKNGIFTNGNILPTYAHNEESLERTARGFDLALGVVGETLQAARSKDSKLASSSVAARRALTSIGSLEALGVEGSNLIVGGWALLAESAPDRVCVRIEAGPEQQRPWIEADSVQRPDVAGAYPDRREASGCGYFARVPLNGASLAVSPDAPLVVTLRLERRAALAFLCRVLIESPLPASGAWPGPFATRDGIVVV